MTGDCSTSFSLLLALIGEADLNQQYIVCT